MIDWSVLRFILAIQRHRTLTAASRALGCSQSTVTRRLAELHDALGMRVLERRGGEYVLSVAGERLRPLLVEIEERVLAVERAALGQDARPSGVVRVTTIETLASRFLPMRLPSFRERFPDIDLELDVDRRSLDLSRREADVALRVMRPRQQSLVARKIGTLGLALYASHEYITRHGVPQLRSDRLTKHAVIVDDDANGWMPEARLLAEATRGARVALRSQSWLTHLAAAEAGLGIAAVPCFLADVSPSLRRLGRDDDSAHRDVWLIVHRDLQETSRVRAVLEFLADTLRAEARALAGTPGKRGKR